MRHRQLTRTRLLSASVLATSILLAACGGGDGGGVTTPPVDNAVATVEVSSPGASVEAGQTMQLSATAKNAAGTAISGKTFAWSSSSDALATVTAGGAVTGRSVGPVTITASVDGRSGTAALTVTPAPIATLVFDPATAQVEAGKTVQLAVTARDAAGNVLTGRTVTLTTSNASVATVSATQLVSGVAPGSATITATAEGKSATAAITVVPVPIATLTIEPGTAQVEAGKTVQLAVTARDAAGNALAGRTVTLVSSNAGVATVSASQLVTGVAPGSATITATAEGKSAVANVTVVAVPVASVTVSPATANVNVGATQALAATLRDAAGATLTGRTVTWTSSSASVATVSATGVVTGVGAGQATITASTEGKSGTSQITVVVPQAARVAITPSFGTVDVGASRSFQASAFDASGSAISNPSVAWSSASPAIATVGASNGSVSGVAAGVAVLTARVNQATAEAAVAVLGPRSLLSTAFSGTDYVGSARAGQTITVPVVLDMSKVSATGDLGSVQFDLVYDPAVLQYESATAGVTGSPSFNVATAGTFKFSFAGTAPQGSARLTLVTITFRVAAAAAVGTERELRLTYTARPTDTNFGNYDLPVTVNGRVRLVSP